MEIIELPEKSPKPKLLSPKSAKVIQLRRQATPDDHREKYRLDPGYFLTNVLGCRYWWKQLEIIKSIRDHRRTGISGCTGSSKSVTGGMAMLWWLFSYFPSRVITFAPSLRQVEMNIWGYAKNLWKNSRIYLGGDFLTTDYKLSEDWYAKGFSTDDEEKAKGIHGKNDLILLDDAQGIPAALHLALRNTMAGGNTHMVMLYNKNVLSGEVYDSHHSLANLWHNIGIRADETPNYKARRVIIDGMITYEQAEEWRKTHGPDSNFVRVMVDDKFPSQEPDTLIPVDWIELAMCRDVPVTDRHIHCGMDVARFGNDNTVIVPIRGRQVMKPRVKGQMNTQDCAGFGIMVFEELNATSMAVDIIFNPGVYDLIYARLSSAILGVNVSIPSEILKDKNDEKKGKKFFNLRSEIWWGIREALNPENPNCIALPKDRDLQAELSSIKYWPTPKGEIRVEEKDEMKTRLNGKSPDRADGLGLAIHAQKKFNFNRSQNIVTVLESSPDEDMED